MDINKIRIGNKEVMPFTIPSGIAMTDARCARRILDLVPEIGIWTTKSIGEKERDKDGSYLGVIKNQFKECLTNL